MSGITNFTLLTHNSGNTIQPSDLDTTFAAIRAVLEQLIENNNRTPLMPIGSTGQVQIPSLITNALFYIDSNGNVTLLSKSTLDDAVTAAAGSATAAAGSAASALASYTAALAMGSLLPAQAGNAGLSLTTDGNVTYWGASVPETLAILNFLGYFS
jgi:hypothetical protein